MKNIASLTRIYLYVMFLIVLLIIFSPFFGGRILPFFREELAQVILICLLFILAYWVRFLYKKESDGHQRKLEEMKDTQVALEKRLDEAFRYIGKVNIQIQEVSDVFSALEKYPENQRDINFIFKYFANKILGLVDANWVLLRVIDVSSATTLKEYFLARGDLKLSKPNISNEIVLANNVAVNDWQMVSTDPLNLDLKAFCIFPAKKTTADQLTLIKGLTTRLEMLFVIFSMLYDKK